MFKQCNFLGLQDFNVINVVGKIGCYFNLLDIFVSIYQCSNNVTDFGFLLLQLHRFIIRVRTHPGQPGIYWNLIIGFPGIDYTGI